MTDLDRWRQIAMKYAITTLTDFTTTLPKDSNFWGEEGVLAAIAEAVAAERERCARICESIYPKIHTHASENSDVYRAQDRAAARCAAAIRAEAEAK